MSLHPSMDDHPHPPASLSLWRAAWVALLLLAGSAAQAQVDFTAYGIADFSYGRFEPSGALPSNRFNSNSLSASFAGANLKYGLDGGWTPGLTLETFVRFQDLRTGRKDEDPLLSRNAFVSLASPYGLLRVGRLQTPLFDVTSRFNAFGPSPAFSPAVRHVYASGNLEGVQRDFLWNRAVAYTSPSIEGVTANVMASQLPQGESGRLVGGSVVVAQGLLGLSIAGQRLKSNDGIVDPTSETTWQIGATYNFGIARVFTQVTATQDDGLDVRSRTGSAGVSWAVGPGNVLAQVAQTTATGPAVDRKHTSKSLGYVYPYDSELDLYLLGMDDRVRDQTRGLSVALGGRWRF